MQKHSKFITNPLELGIFCIKPSISSAFAIPALFALVCYEWQCYK